MSVIALNNICYSQVVSTTTHPPNMCPACKSWKGFRETERKNVMEQKIKLFLLSIMFSSSCLHFTTTVRVRVVQEDTAGEINLEGISLGGLKLNPCLRRSDSKTWLHHEGSLSPTIPSLLVIPRRSYPIPPPSITARRSSESHGGLGRQKMSRLPGRSGLGPPEIAERFLLHSPFALSAHIPADHRRFPQSGLSCGVLGKTFAPVQMVGFCHFHLFPHSWCFCNS